MMFDLLCCPSLFCFFCVCVPEHTVMFGIKSIVANYLTKQNNDVSASHHSQDEVVIWQPNIRNSYKGEGWERAGGASPFENCPPPPSPGIVLQ